MASSCVTLSVFWTLHVIVYFWYRLAIISLISIIFLILSVYVLNLKLITKFSAGQIDPT